MKNRYIFAVRFFTPGVLSVLAIIGLVSLSSSALAQTDQPARQFNSAQAGEAYQVAKNCLNEKGYVQGDTLSSEKYQTCLQRIQEILDSLGTESNQCLSQCTTNKPGSTNCDTCVKAYSAGGYTERTFSACDSFCREKSPGQCGQCGSLRDQKKKEVSSAAETAVEDWIATHKTVEPPPTVTPPPQVKQPNESPKTPAPEPAITTKNLSVGVDIKEGDTVTTGKNERIIITFSDGAKVQIEANSSFKLFKKDEAKAVKGKFQFFFEKLVKGRKYYIHSPNATVSVRGTEFSIDVLKNKTIVKVTEGVVAVSDTKKKKTVNVKAGYQISVTGKTVSKAGRF